MIYPSQRAVWLAVIGMIPAFLVALFLPQFWYAGLGWVALLAGLCLVDAAASADRRKMHMLFSCPESISVGSAADAKVSVHFAGASPRRVEARIGHDEHIAAVDGIMASHDIAINNGSGAAQIAFEAARRGMAVFDRLWLRWTGPFGLVWKQVEAPLGNEMAVMPDITTARREAIRLLQREALTGEQVQLDLGGGGEFDALADYQPGKARRSIDWKRSARHANLLVKEYRAERNNSIVFAIDSGRLMCEPVDGLPKIDRAVSAALLSSFLALRNGDMVRIFGFDARPRALSGVVRGIDGLPLLQRIAAEIDYSTEETNFTLALTTLDGKLERRSLVVIFTDFADTTGASLMLRSVAQLAKRHLILFCLMKDEELEGLADTPPESAEDVARAVTAWDLLRDRRIIIGQLRAAGAHVIEASHDKLGPALVDSYLTIKKQSLL